jgi:hypothetical protein
MGPFGGKSSIGSQIQQTAKLYFGTPQGVYLDGMLKIQGPNPIQQRQLPRHNRVFLAQAVTLEMQKLLMMQLTTTAMPVIPTKREHGTRPVLSLRNQGFDAVFPNHKV